MPIDTCSVVHPEREKYARIWGDVPEYREVSIGEQLVGAFLVMTSAQPGQIVLDAGCGCGRASAQLAGLGFQVVALDLVPDALDQAVRELAADTQGNLTFVEQVLWNDWPVVGDCDHVFCSDVLEHIPPEFTMLVAQRCIDAAGRYAFLHINFEPDAFGARIGQPLHLTVQPFDWWRDRLAQLGELVEARDLLGHGIFLLRGSS